LAGRILVHATGNQAAPRNTLIAIHESDDAGHTI